MAGRSHKRLWLLWATSMLIGAAVFSYALTKGVDKRMFMPGPMTHGHHQIELACEACHGDTAFAANETMDDACMDCHGDQRKKPLDSHPKRKFKDPRNADRLEKIDVLRCMTCHLEHQPEITHREGYTQPGDFCVHCHSGIGEERPTHAGMGFDTCNDAGCHNFHNNRALYTDFLLRHGEKPDFLERRRLPRREFGQVLDQLMDYPRDRYPVTTLTLVDIDAPAEKQSKGVNRDWLTTAHAKAGVNCSACHQAAADASEPPPWTDHPDRESCRGCHDAEVDGFERGLHGMRLPQGLPAMTPAFARLPMRADADDRSLTCTSCHGAHRFDTSRAAVEACLGCHADNHSLAYEGSPHHRLWLSELDGAAPPGTGISCATCHMPRVDFEPNDWMSRILVDHNQSATLKPNEKMIRPACLHCHGLRFSIDALADPALIENNFRGRPSVHVESIDMAIEFDRRAREEVGG